MKAVCKSNVAIDRRGEIMGTYSNLTVGKTYELTKSLDDSWEDTYTINIIDDLNGVIPTPYHTYLFYSPDELRDNFIKNILDVADL